MIKKLNIILIIGLSLFNSPLQTKEIYKNQEYISSNVEEIAEEMKILNTNLKLLSTTISNLIN